MSLWYFEVIGFRTGILQKLVKSTLRIMPFLVSRFMCFTYFHHLLILIDWCSGFELPKFCLFLHLKCEKANETHQVFKWTHESGWIKASLIYSFWQRSVTSSAHCLIFYSRWSTPELFSHLGKVFVYTLLFCNAPAATSTYLRSLHIKGLARRHLFTRWFLGILREKIVSWP